MSSEKTTSGEPSSGIERKRRRLYDPLVESDSVQPESGEAVEESPDAEKTNDHAPSSESYKDAVKIVKKYTRLASTVGFVPIPLAEMVILTGLHVQMLRSLCKHYGVPFSVDRGKRLIAALVSGVNMGLLGNSILKAVPFVGLGVAVATSVTLSMALTYGVGIVFAKHFESGGTLLDFNVKKKKAALKSELTEKKKS